MERAQIMAWRRAERERLIAARVAMPVADKQAHSAQIAQHLDHYLRTSGWLRPGNVLSAYWPLRGEPDLRPWLARLHAEGVQCAMPVVEVKAQPLTFRPWAPGCKMIPGFWNIPVPADPAQLTPQVLLAPVVGFDAQGYRLGYGGGYFDRTLAGLRATNVAHVAVALGYAAAQIDSIRPLPHDISFAATITEQGLHERACQNQH